MYKHKFHYEKVSNIRVLTKRRVKECTLIIITQLLLIEQPDRHNLRQECAAYGAHARQ